MIITRSRRRRQARTLVSNSVLVWISYVWFLWNWIPWPPWFWCVIFGNCLFLSRVSWVIATLLSRFSSQVHARTNRTRLHELRCSGNQVHRHVSTKSLQASSCLTFSTSHKLRGTNPTQTWSLCTLTDFIFLFSSLAIILRINRWTLANKLPTSSISSWSESFPAVHCENRLQHSAGFLKKLTT